MNDTFLTLFIVVFIFLGVYNVFSGLRRQREARSRGQRLVWYKQINLLTGLEYLLLSFVFMLSLNIRNKTLPGFLQPLVIPLYLLVLLSSAILAGFVIRQAILNARLSRQSPPSQASRNGVGDGRSVGTIGTGENELSSEQRSANIQHRRERRQKAAASRRRRSGRT